MDELARDPATGDLIVEELVKLPAAELKARLDAFPVGDGRLSDMMQRDADRNHGTTKADRDLAYEIGLMIQTGEYSRSSW
jgi:hypothetical protein